MKTTTVMITKIADTPLRRSFKVLNYTLCSLIGLMCVLPVIHILALSFSGIDAVVSNKVAFWPVDFTTENYEIVIADLQFFVSYGVSFIRAGLGWFIGIILTVLAAYPMSQSKRTFPARRFFVCFFMGTMLFNGGMIPTYLVVKETGLLNSVWALILPCAFSTYNLILMMNFMKGIPESLTEASFVDGAGHWRNLFQIILPLCKPSIATISLFIILGHWNAWFDGMIYIKDMALKPLQTYLRSIVIVDSAVGDNGGVFLEDMIANASSDGSNGAKIFLAIFPILCIYPFLQKHFAKGIIRGSVKE